MYLLPGCSGRDLSEVIWDIAGQRLNGTPDKGYGELLFSRGTEEYRLTVQLIDSGREQAAPEITVIPVSYTHLDVYKRQPI